MERKEGMLMANVRAAGDKNITDMTKGTPIKHILLFSLPLLLGNIFQQLYNMIDSVVVGNYVGANALAAVGVCGSLNFLFFSLSFGLGVGIGVIVSQYFGARDERRLRLTIANSSYVLIASSVTVCIIGLIFGRSILGLLGTPATLIDDSAAYLQITCMGIPFVALYNGVAAILRALGDSKTPLYFLILSSILNVIFDLTFVLGLGMGVRGVALATIICQAISAVASIIYAYKRVSYFKLKLEDLKPNKEIILKSFRLGLPISLQNSMIAVSCMALQGVVNTFGDDVIAAYTITGRIEMLIQQPYSSISAAVTTYSGQNYGAKKPERIRKGFFQTMLVILAFSLFMLPLAYLFGENIIGFFVKDADVIALGAMALKITSPFYFGLGMIYLPRAVLNGCGDAGFAMINGLCEVTCRLGYSYIFTNIPALGFRGIWLTTAITWVTTAVVCFMRYRYIQRSWNAPDAEFSIAAKNTKPSRKLAMKSA